MRFREDELVFKVTGDGMKDAGKKKETASDAAKDNAHVFDYPDMTKTLGGFKLSVEAGTFRPSEIMMMLGQNGTGKTTFIKMLAGILKPDDEERELPRLAISYKPQTIAPKF